MSRKQVSVWCKQFKSRRTALDDDPKGGQRKPSTTKTDDNQQITAAMELLTRDR